VRDRGGVCRGRGRGVPHHGRAWIDCWLLPPPERSRQAKKAGGAAGEGRRGGGQARAKGARRGGVWGSGMAGRKDDGMIREWYIRADGRAARARIVDRGRKSQEWELSLPPAIEMMRAQSLWTPPPRPPAPAPPNANWTRGAHMKARFTCSLRSRGKGRSGQRGGARLICDCDCVDGLVFSPDSFFLPRPPHGKLLNRPPFPITYDDINTLQSPTHTHTTHNKQLKTLLTRASFTPHP